MDYRFGRSEHDVVRLAAAPAHRFGVRLASPVVDRSAVDYTVNMYGNDLYGDCTCVSMANYARGVAALNGFEITITDQEVEALFAAVGGTTDLASIPGLVAQDVIDYQAQKGFLITGQSLVAVPGVVANDRNSLSHAIERLGGAYVGVRLYERDMDSVGGTWDTSGAPGKMVGRHMINLWDYNTKTLRLGTWATLQVATWEWIEDRIDEAHALVWRQLAAANGLFYDGVNADGMIAEMA